MAIGKHIHDIIPNNTHINIKMNYSRELHIKEPSAHYLTCHAEPYN